MAVLRALIEGRPRRTDTIVVLFYVGCTVVAHRNPPGRSGSQRNGRHNQSG